MQDNNAQIPALKKLTAMLELRKKRGAVLPAPTTPLDEQDSKLFDIIRNQFRQKIVDESVVSPQEAEKIFQSAIEPYGKKAVVDFYTKIRLVYGVPYKWFIINAVISLAVYVGFDKSINANATMFTAVTIQAVQYVVYSRIKDRVQKEKTENILRQGAEL